MSRPRRTTLHVFISSPGDCAEERALLRDVVRRVSDSDAARDAGIELKPLLWEELPPGPAAPGDLQSRINTVLDRYGLRRYEIYAGVMKDRIGTPTARYRSGTVEELETALAGHRRAQVPAEVLFYFIDSPDRAAEVRQFREELSARGLLYAVVSGRDELEQRFTAHLTRIVTEWRLWRNRLRRTFRSARSAAAIAATILLVVRSRSISVSTAAARAVCRRRCAPEDPPPRSWFTNGRRHTCSRTRCSRGANCGTGSWPPSGTTRWKARPRRRPPICGSARTAPGSGVKTMRSHVACCATSPRGGSSRHCWRMASTSRSGRGAAVRSSGRRCAASRRTSRPRRRCKRGRASSASPRTYWPRRGRGSAPWPAPMRRRRSRSCVSRRRQWRRGGSRST